MLVIGGGITALLAALEARKQVDDVILVCKRKTGRSGNTIVSGAAFSAHIPCGENPDSSEQHLRDTVQAGAGINDPVLARILAEEGGQAVLALEDYGVRLLRHDGSLVRRIPPGHSRPRSIPTDLRGYPHGARGLSISIPLLEIAQRRGIRIMSHMPVAKLMVKEGTVCGATALDIRSGEWVKISAKALILAAGGGGCLFEHTNNTPDMTGDAFALAMDAGVPLRDMEFVQFYPTRAVSPVRTNISSPLFAEGAVLRNCSGERFMPSYDPQAEMTTRDVMSRAIYAEAQAGRGVAKGGVYIDLSAVPTATLELKFPTILTMLRRHKIDRRTQWLVVSPAAHFIMGGALIGPRCETAVAGLFAAGEAAGGVHGANRLAGNALTETAVFGLKAGREAGAYCHRERKTIEATEGGIEVPAAVSGTIPSAAIKSEVRRILWQCAGLVRTEVGLKRGLAELQACQGVLPNCRRDTAAGQAAWFETSGMVQVGKAIVLACLSRQESRGAHYRSDFPDRDEVRWKRGSVIQKAGDTLIVDPLYFDVDIRNYTVA